MKDYYKAYDDRYRSLHQEGMTWMVDRPTPLVWETLASLGLGLEDRILEVGCGEGRDSIPLLDRGYRLEAIDVSPSAVAYCRSRGYQEAFFELDILKSSLIKTYDVIFSIAVLHMLVGDRERLDFLEGLARHLKEGGRALITSMGDGVRTSRSDPDRAFNQVERVHQASGRKMVLAETSCRVVDWGELKRELDQAGLEIIDAGITRTVPEFDQMIYVLVKRG